jgi:hypothetical protein
MIPFLPCGEDDDDNVFAASMSVFLVLFDAYPELLETDFKEKMAIVLRRDAMKAIVFLSIYAQAFGQRSKDWDLIDFLFRHQKTFLKNACGTELLSIVYSLSSRLAIFRQERKRQIFELFTLALRSPDEKTISVCYSGLCYLVGQPREASIESELDFGQVVHHLSIEGVRDDCLAFLVRLRELPCLPELVFALLECATTKREAVLCLLNIAAGPDGAGLIVQRPAWLDSDLPTLLDTLRLLLAVLTHSGARRMLARLPQLSAFLRRLIVNESDPRALTYVSSIVKKLELNERILRKMSESGLLQELFKRVRKSRNEMELRAALVVLMQVGEVGFSGEYLIMLPTLKRILEAEGALESWAVEAAAIVSKYGLCAQKFKELRVDQIFEGLKGVREYAEYVRVFFANMTVTEYY